MNNNKGFVLPFVILIIIIGTVLTFVYTRSTKTEISHGDFVVSTGDDFPKDYIPADHKGNTTPDTSTSDWKTYTNKEFGFSVKYPASYADGLTFSKTKMNDKFVSATLLQIYKPGEHVSEFGPTMNVSVMKQPFDVSGKVYTDIHTFVDDFFSGKTISNKKDIVINAYKALQIDTNPTEDEIHESPENQPRRYAFVLKDGIIFSASYTLNSYPEFDSMLRSLSLFTSLGQKELLSKTFESKKYGFTLEYPGAFITSESNDAGYFDELNLYHVAVTAPTVYQPNTDFSGAYVDISISPKTENCKKQNPQGSMFTGTKTIGGVTFYFDPSQPFSDAAMGGQRGQTSLFTTVYNDKCYRIQKSLSYRDLHGFVDEPHKYPPHFDEKKVDNDLEGIINSFKFTK